MLGDVDAPGEFGHQLKHLDIPGLWTSAGEKKVGRPWHLANFGDSIRPSLVCVPQAETHFDTFENLHAMIVGAKRFWLVPPHYARCVGALLLFVCRGLLDVALAQASLHGLPPWAVPTVSGNPL